MSKQLIKYHISEAKNFVLAYLPSSCMLLTSAKEGGLYASVVPKDLLGLENEIWLDITNMAPNVIIDEIKKNTPDYEG